jgi:hypothetical protein
MKHNFTKLMAITAILLMSVYSVNAQTPDAKIEGFTSGWTNQTFNSGANNQIYMFHSGASVSSGTVTCFGSSSGYYSVRPDSNGDYFQLELNYTGTTNTLDQVSFSVTANSTTTTYVGHYGWSTDGTTWTNGAQFSMPSSSGTCATYTIAAPTGAKYFRIMRNSTSTTWAGTLGGGQTIRILGVSVWVKAEAPSITKFVAEGVEATIDQNAKTITAQLPYGTSLTSITPTVTIGGTATDYSPKGAQDFTNPVVYTATDGTNNVDYTVTLTVNPTPSSEKDLSNVTIGGKTPTFDAGTNTYSIMLPKASSLTQTVTFTKPSTATANFTSGNSHDFTNPLQITVTAQDGSTKVYTLTAQVGIADIAYVSTAATPHANDTKIYPMLLEKGYYVNVIAATGTDLTQFNPYDIVVLCENVSSSNTLALAMNGLIKTKRFLSFKAFMYGKTGWPTGTPSDGTSDANVAIEADYLAHPIFSGVTLTGNLANILTDPAAKGVQGVLNPQENVSSKIAYLTSSGNTDKVALIENNQMPTAKYLMIPIQTDSYAKVNANGLKLIENAITYLLTDTKFGPYTGVTKNNLTNISFNGRTILNPEHQQLNVFDATGRLIINSREDINMSAQAKGVYLVKGDKGMMKIAITK